jgi:hypothetical protein
MVPSRWSRQAFPHGAATCRLPAQEFDLGVLGEQSGYRQGLELGQLGQPPVARLDPSPQFGVLLLEPLVPGGPRVFGRLPGIAWFTEHRMAHDVMRKTLADALGVWG